jgi:hypothetical protein
VNVEGPVLDFRVIAPNGTVTTMPVVDELETATRHSFLAGKVGLQAHLVDASFDNVCVSRNGDTCANADRFLAPSLVSALSP